LALFFNSKQGSNNLPIHFREDSRARISKNAFFNINLLGMQLFQKLRAPFLGLEAHESEVIGHKEGTFHQHAVDTATQRPTAVFVGAVVDEALFAEEALPTEGLHVHRDSIAGLYVCNRRTHFFHNTHHLVTHRDPLHGSGNAAMLDVQVTGANAGKSHLDDGIPIVLDRGLGLFNK
jgi:hypothetical protein